jgi:hypothetical protein
VGAQVAGHENHGSGEINLAVVSESQSRFVQDAEEQVPECVARLFDFIKKDKADLHRFRVVLVDHFLAQERVRFAMSQVSRR